MNTIQKLTARMGIELNDMQKASAAALLNTHDDAVILSPTGTGKTLAYLLPLTQLVDAASDEVQAIVVVPGRELALQSAEVLKSVKSGLRGYACYGGRAAMDEHREIRQLRPQVIFGTPGRLIDHIGKENFGVTKTTLLIIDEFDKCLEMGFRPELSRLTEMLSYVKRRILLSATEAEEIPSFVDLQHARRLDFLPKMDEGNSRITTYVCHSPQKDKLETLAKLLLSLGQAGTVVFVNYRDSVERTANWLADQGFSVVAYHGGLDQKGREEAIFRFACGAVNILVSTDLGSRGLDIPDIRNIIHYHLPETQDNYIHRIGRTARWDATGRTVFLLGPDEQLPDYVDSVEEYSLADALEEVEREASRKGLPLQPAQSKRVILYIGKGKRDKISKGDVVGFLCKTGGLKGTEIGRIDVRDYYCYAAVDRECARSVLRKVDGQKIKGHKTLYRLMA